MSQCVFEFLPRSSFFSLHWGSDWFRLRSSDKANLAQTTSSSRPATRRRPTCKSVGSSVRWINNDSIAHELVLDFSDGVSSPLLDLQPGADFTLAFSDAETVTFRSEDDPGVTGTIVVGSSAPAPTATSTTAASTATTVAPTATSTTVPQSTATTQPANTATATTAASTATPTTAPQSTATSPAGGSATATPTTPAGASATSTATTQPATTATAAASTVTHGAGSVSHLATAIRVRDNLAEYSTAHVHTRGQFDLRG